MIRRLLLGAMALTLASGTLIGVNASGVGAAQNTVTLQAPWNCTKGGGELSFGTGLSPLGTGPGPTIKVTVRLRGCTSATNIHFHGEAVLTATTGLSDNNCNFRLLPSGTTPPLSGTITWLTDKPKTTIAPSTGVNLPAGVYTAGASPTLSWSGGVIGGGSLQGAPVHLNFALRKSSTGLAKECIDRNGLTGARIRDEP